MCTVENFAREGKLFRLAYQAKLLNSLFNTTPGPSYNVSSCSNFEQVQYDPPLLITEDFLSFWEFADFPRPSQSSPRVGGQLYIRHDHHLAQFCTEVAPYSRQVFVVDKQLLKWGFVTICDGLLSHATGDRSLTAIARGTPSTFAFITPAKYF